MTHPAPHDPSAPEGDSFLYFAYGSNMCSARLLERTPSARALGHAVLPGHTLRWHMRGRDGSGKCDVVPCPAGGEVHGVLWRIGQADRAALDLAEGLGHAYSVTTHAVRPVALAEPSELQALFYVALVTEPQALPFGWYRALVLSGAEEHRLPQHYRQALAAQAAIQDTDAQRHARHMRLAGWVD